MNHVWLARKRQFASFLRVNNARADVGTETFFSWLSIHIAKRMMFHSLPYLLFPLSPSSLFFPFLLFYVYSIYIYIRASHRVTRAPWTRLALVLFSRQVLMGSQSRTTSTSKVTWEKLIPWKSYCSVVRELRGQRSVPNALHSYFHSTL